MGGPFICDAANFHYEAPSYEYTYLNSAPTGASDSQTGILSVWWYYDGADSGSRAILRFCKDGAGGNIIMPYLLYSAGWTIQFASVQNTAATSSIYWTPGYPIPSASTWYHTLTSWDYTNTLLKNRLNDTAYQGTPGKTGTSIGDWSVCDRWHVGHRHDNDAWTWDGGIAELYFAHGQYLDFDTESNRRKFRDATGKPVSLGSNGSTPTGSTPLLYFHLDDGETANNFATNRAGGSNFSVSGTLSTHGSSPSD
jgi:hypothetical protein